MKRIMAVVAVVMVLSLALSAGTASAWGPGPGNVYVVQRGDTLSGIAFNLGVSLYELARINRIFNPNLIWVGQCLTIPEPCYGGGCGGYQGGYGYPTSWGGYNNCGQGCYGGYQGGYGNCGKGCYGGYNQGYWGGYQGGYQGYPAGWGYGYQGGNGYWGGYGYNGGCSTCNQGGYPIPFGFKESSITLENNVSRTFDKG